MHFRPKAQKLPIIKPLHRHAMVRRTKADADATRNSLLDAAELLFQAHGVSRTSLNDIAVAAGTTRGAIYWHFKDKADLFNAMMDRATLPMEETLVCMGTQAHSLEDPLQALRSSLLDALSRISHDAQVRRVFEVATLQVEYNEEMRAVRERHLEVRQHGQHHGRLEGRRHPAGPYATDAPSDCCSGAFCCGRWPDPQLAAGFRSV